MPAAAVVEDLEVLEHRVHQLEAGAAALVVEGLDLHACVCPLVRGPEGLSVYGGEFEHDSGCYWSALPARHCSHGMAQS